MRGLRRSSGLCSFLVFPILVCVQATFAETNGYLRKALDAGFRDRKQLMKDKELTALRSMPEFHELLVEHHVEK